jgi:hypothetical protein
MKKIVTFALFGFLWIGCSEPESTSSCSPVRYGDKVYYFPCTGASFGMSLEIFLEDSTKKITTMAGNGTGDRGHDKGYFVVIE